jgi:hypothetical protein
MSKFALFGAAAVLSTMSISALHAQAVTRELGTCPSPSVASSETRAPAPTADWLPPGCEKSTLPWSAPVGHRQPQLIDVLQAKSLSEPALDEENANIDRVVRSICRSC